MENKHYELQILPLFENDLNAIIDYITIALKNPEAAVRLVDDVETAITERLSASESSSSNYERRHPYYRITLRNLIIFYIVIGNAIEVQRILYIIVTIVKNRRKQYPDHYDRGIFYFNFAYVSSASSSTALNLSSAF